MMKDKKYILLLCLISFSSLSIEQIQASQYGKMLGRSAIAVGYAFASQQNSMSEPDQHSQDNDVDAVKYPEFAKFVKRYRCSAELEQQIKKEDGNIKHIQNGVYEYKEILFMNKGHGVDRIINAQRTKKVIAAHALDHIGVPDKCLCKMRKNEWNVIVQKVEIKPVYDRTYSLVDTQQLAKLIEESCYSDVHNKNIVKDDQDKIMIIDTENRSYPDSYSSLSKMCLRMFILSLDRGEKEAQQWLDENIKHDEAMTVYLWYLLFGAVTLKNNRQYDDTDIDFEKVKEEFAAFNSEYW